MTKVEIENFLKGKGDFVQIDHLTRLLTDKMLPIDKRKFVCQKLAELYEKKNMYGEAAKMSNNVSLASTTFTEKMKAHVKEAELYVKAGLFREVDEAVKKAVAEANTVQRNEINNAVKEFYKRQAEIYEKTRKIGNAVKLYEKMLEMNISDSERQEIKGKLMGLYEKLGRVKDYFTIKRGDFGVRR